MILINCFRINYFIRRVYKRKYQSMKFKRFDVIRIIFTACYLFSAGVLIYEACQNGTDSSNKSSFVGGTIANLINGIGGDQTIEVAPTSLIISNKISEAHVGEELTLTTITFPENATNKSINFTSTDPDVISITSGGYMRFLKEGSATIIAENINYRDVKDTMTVEVSNIEVESIKSEINAPIDEDIYTLTVGKTYDISNTIEPTNATIQTVEYEMDDNEYISLDNQGKIAALAASYDNIIEIKTYCGLKQSVLKVVTKPYEVDPIPLEAIIPDESTKEIYVTELYTPSFSFAPVNSNGKGYSLSSSNSNVASIEGGKTVRGLKEGKTIISATSVENPNVKCSIELTVKTQPVVTDFSLGQSLTMKEGATRSICVSNIQPAYANASAISYTSDDDGVASISSDGKIEAIKPGTTNINVSVGSITKSIQIIVNAKPLNDKTTTFDFEYLKEPFIYANKPVKVSSFIKITDFKSGEEIYTPDDSNITYSLNDSSFGSIDGDTLISKYVGEFTLYITHNSSGVTKEATFTSIDDFLIDGQKNPKQCNINYGEFFEFAIDNSKDELIRDLKKNQWWNVSHGNDSLVTVKNNGDTYGVTGVGEGGEELTITPYLDDTPINALSKKIAINVTHIKTKNFIVSMTRTSLDGNTCELTKNKINKCYINDELKLSAKIDDGTTSSNITFSSSDSSIVEIANSGELTPKSIGKATITATESVSGITKKFDLNIENRILLNQDTPFAINGASINEKDGYYEIMNGTIGNIILNYTNDTSYKTVQWKSDNEKIVTIGGDGTISPLKAGKAIITATIDDGYSSEKSELIIKLNITKQPVIKDLQQFFGFIRKVVGHFGAFLVFGIFSALTFMLWFSGRKWRWSIPLTFIQGFGLAVLTECIQLGIPGRSGAFKDVLIDSSGCFIGIIITGGLIVWLTLRRWKKTQNKI